MANTDYVDLLKQDIPAWNAVRDDVRHSLLSAPDLSGADLSDITLSDANLEGVNLDKANLSRTVCWGTNFNGARLNKANFKGADLRFADLSGAELTNANFYGAYMGRTILGDINLSEVKSLQTIRHDNPSSIGIDTIYNSRGNIPEKFLRGCGVPESFIVQIPALVAATQPIQFYSCFISYSSQDKEFAERLYADLQSQGVRCWFAPEDLKIGEKFRVRIDESIRLYDKLLLVLSEEGELALVRRAPMDSPSWRAFPR